MQTSEHVDQLAVALVKAQAAIEAVVKDKTGKIKGKDGKDGYEYKYSDLASVIEHVKEPLNANGICFLQSPGRAEGGVMVVTRLMHVSGQWAQSETFVPVPYGSAQAYGSAITYGKRYGLQAMTGLPSEDDDGKRASEDEHGKTLADRTKDYSMRLVERGKAKPITATQEAHDTFAGMSPEQQIWLKEQAMEIIGIAEKGGDCHGHIDAQKYDTEEKLALWSLLPSNVRSTIKKQREQSQLATQP